MILGYYPEGDFIAMWYYDENMHLTLWISKTNYVTKSFHSGLAKLRRFHSSRGTLLYDTGDL